MSVCRVDVVKCDVAEVRSVSDTIEDLLHSVIHGSSICSQLLIVRGKLPYAFDEARGSPFRVEAQSRAPLTASARSSNRTPRRRWSRCSSPLESPNHSRWQLHRNEQVGGIHVVLAGFVDDSDVTFAACFAVGKNLINLAYLKVLHTAVFHTQRERTGCLLNSHDVNPGSA